MLIDGHNRYAICQKHGIEFDTKSIQLADEDAAMVWIIRNQFGRRNITLTSRCELAEKLAEALRPKAEANRIAGNAAGGKSEGKSKAKLPTTEKINTRAKTAKAAKVSERKMRKARAVRKASQPVLHFVLHRGHSCPSPMDAGERASNHD